MSRAPGWGVHLTAPERAVCARELRDEQWRQKQLCVETQRAARRAVALSTRRAAMAANARQARARKGVARVARFAALQRARRGGGEHAGTEDAVL